jgi:hypothetical protein
MAAVKVSEVAAFEIFRSASSKANRKLRILAEELAETGEIRGVPAVTADDGPGDVSPEG